ncbi:MAG: LptF/LptG family permease [Candidatus Omnitrophica bacterium]|nr:LptF/LptG family permease [Candidatus Omnitrophota bacterium]
MSLLRRYILRELLGPCLMAFAIFTFVLVTGNLVKLADLLVNKGVPLWDVLRLFSLLIPSLLSHTVPMAILTGTLLAFGRLSSDQEITAMQASGVSLWSLAVPVAAAGVVASLLLVFVNDHLVPTSRFATRKVLEQIGIRNPAAYLEPGVFVKEFRPYVLFVYQMDGNHLAKIRIYEPMEGRPTRTILAERGEFLPMPDTKQVQFRLYQGTSDEPDPRDPARFYKLEFASYTMTLSLDTGRDPSNLRKKPKDMTYRELRGEIRELAAQGIDPSPLATEAHRRMATAGSGLAFVLIGMPLAIRTRRAERSIGYALSLALILVYYLLLLGAQSLAGQGLAPAGPVLWLPNLLTVAVGLLLLHRAGRR